MGRYLTVSAPAERGASCEAESPLSSIWNTPSSPYRHLGWAFAIWVIVLRDRTTGCRLAGLDLAVSVISDGTGSAGGSDEENPPVQEIQDLASGVISTSYKIVQKLFSEPRVRSSVFRILEENELCSMATVTRGNRPHINTAFFCYSPDLEVYFLSAPVSLHARNLTRNRSMAMAVFSSSQGWDKPGRGVQLFGTCRKVNGRGTREAEALYGRRFLPYAQRMASTRADDKKAAAQLRSYRFYRFLPKRVKILDESEFGGAVFVVSAIPRGRR